jgi:hypothetical protein
MSDPPVHRVGCYTVPIRSIMRVITGQNRRALLFVTAVDVVPDVEVEAGTFSASSGFSPFCTVSMYEYQHRYRDYNPGEDDPEDLRT